MNTFGIPNHILNVPYEQEVGLYVRYPLRSENEVSYWTAFKETDYNKHQIEALKIFVDSGLNEMEVSVPHCQGGIFKVNFKKLPRINERYNNIYMYEREDGSIVSLIISYSGQIGFINRISCEPV